MSAGTLASASLNGGPAVDSPIDRRPRALRTTLLAVIAVGLVLLGGGLAVALGIGRTEVPSGPRSTSTASIRLSISCSPQPPPRSAAGRHSPASRTVTSSSPRLTWA